MKLQNIFNSNFLTLTQGYHGANQGKLAFDIIQSSSDVGRLVAPANGEVKFQHKQGKLSFFNFNLEDGSYIQFVHALPVKLGKFKLGDFLGSTTWHHHHVGLWVKGIGWQSLLEYTDRNIILRGVSGLSKKWTNWNTYRDLHINIDTMPEYTQPTDKEWQEIQKWQGDIKRLTGIELVKQLDKDMERLLRVIYRNEKARKQLQDGYPV